jgi:predicted SprT family Zn-dependent metalloprotease
LAVRRSEIESLAHGLMVRYGLDRWQFAFNRRKRALGLCRYTERRIELSMHFASAHDEPEVRDVILHEIAHAIAGHKAAHGPRWKSICQAIGARPERCGTAKMPPGSWQAVCPRCRDRFDRYRRPKRNRTYSCPRCGPNDGKLSFRAK